MPQLILIGFLLIAAWLIKRDIAQRPGVSRAIWLPTLWVGIIASRPVSTWLGITNVGDTVDGSPVDRLFYLGIILAALIVLAKRSIEWGWVTAKNWPLIVFYGFFFISIAWANVPFSSFKRWFKEIGNIFLVLVILTEVNPTQAARAVFVRCALVLIPLSLIFLRYFPHLGRRYNMHSGGMEVIGVTFQKNSLGSMLLACGLILFWDWMERRKSPEYGLSKVDKYVFLIVGGIGIYLLKMCDSMTSILALSVAGAIVFSVRLPVMRRNISAFGVYVLFAIICFFLIDQQIGLVEAVVHAVGRNMTFTGRTEVWEVLLKVGTDPLLGTGFMSFWDDQKFQALLPPWIGSSAHNGYLEIYLAGGAVGIAALSVMLLGTMAKVNRDLREGTEYAIVRFSILVMALMANFTESNFGCMTPIGFLFILAAVGSARPAAPFEPTPSFDLDATRAAITTEETRHDSDVEIRPHSS